MRDAGQSGCWRGCVSTRSPRPTGDFQPSTLAHFSLWADELLCAFSLLIPRALAACSSVYSGCSALSLRSCEACVGVGVVVVVSLSVFPAGELVAGGTGNPSCTPPASIGSVDAGATCFAGAVVCSAELGDIASTVRV